MRKIPLEKFAKFKILLCCMISMMKVRQVMESDVLKPRYKYGYQIRSATFEIGLTKKYKESDVFREGEAK